LLSSSFAAATRPSPATARTTVINELLDAGADVTLRNNSGQTPLHLAAREGKKHDIELLIREGADIHASDDDGQTPLQLAAAHVPDGPARKEILLLLAAPAAAGSSSGDLRRSRSNTPTLSPASFSMLSPAASAVASAGTSPQPPLLSLAGPAPTPNQRFSQSVHDAARKSQAATKKN
jgi:ankyrin repeat protein